MIYKNVIRLCSERGMSVSALEKELGLGNATIRKWETSDPRAGTLKLVADYFGVTIDSIIDDRDKDETA